MKLAELFEAKADKSGFLPMGYGPKKGHTIEAYGRKGMKNEQWRKMFKNQAQLEKWLDDNDATLEGSRDLDKNEIREGAIGDAVKGVKRAFKGKLSAKETEHDYARSARSAIKHKTPEQADKHIERFVKVSKVVSPKAFPPGYKAPKRQS